MSLQDVIAAIKAAPYVSFGQNNPRAFLESGYEYRATKDVDWAFKSALDFPVGVARVAWAIASEAPDIRHYPQYSVAIGEAILNAGHEHVTRDKRVEVSGRFGRQSGRWCSSFNQPSAKHVACAREVWNRYELKEPDLLADGAIAWIDPKVQDYMNGKKPATNPTPEVVISRRYKVGLKWVGHQDELDDFRLMLFGLDGVSEKEAISAITEGRKRWAL